MLLLLESVHSGVKGLVRCDHSGQALDHAQVRVEDRDKVMVTTHRGEYWRLLLPGSYLISASHTNKWGTLESEPRTVEVVAGQVVRLDLQCKLSLEDSFIVTGVRKGFCRFLDNSKLESEVKSLFDDARVKRLELCEEECKKVPDDPLNVQVGFRVDIVMNYDPLAEFFAERWSENDVRRPSTDFDQKKLQRRLVMYSEEKWCGRRQDGDWIVRRWEK